MSSNANAQANPRAVTETGAGDGAVVTYQLVATSDLLKLIAAVDLSKADPSTLQSVSKLLTEANATVAASMSKKRNEPDVNNGTKTAAVEEEDPKEKKAKKQKRLQKQLGEYTTTADDVSNLGRGVFQTPAGKRPIKPTTPSAPARDGIRTGRQYQADIPPFDPTGFTRERADQLVEDPVADHKAKLADGLKKRRPCGTPGCMLPDHHAGPHSNEASVGSRRLCLPARDTSDTPKETVAEDQQDEDSVKGDEPNVDPMDDEVTVTEIKADNRLLIQTKDKNGACRMGGSTPVLVKLDARRASIIDGLKKKHGADFGGDEADMEQVSDHFTALLLASGYTEGSFDYKKNCHNLDGNVYKYPRYLRKFMESGVFKVRSDFFLPDAKNKALEFAEKYGIETAKRSPKYATMNDQQKAAFAHRHKINIMHGFDDFVKLSSA